MNHVEPFLHPYQVQLLKNQIKKLIHTFYFVGDSRVLAATKDSMHREIIDLFQPQTKEQVELLLDATKVRDKEELNIYMARIDPYIIPFPSITQEEIKKLFPKVKKLVLPGLSAVDFKTLNYLGWRDIAANRLYIVHQEDGKWVGTLCKYVNGAKNRTGICAWCNQIRTGDQIGLVTAQAKKRHADDYKTSGMHICLDSTECNHSITSLEGFEKFFELLRR